MTALLVVLLESVKSAAPPLRPPRSWAMENGAVYGPTTEEDPRPVRGARSGLAAYFSLSRLPSRRLALKVLQLVSPRPRWPSRARGQGVWPPGPPACGLGRLPSCCCFSTCLLRKRRFPHPQFLLSRRERGALPPAARSLCTPVPPPLGLR